MMIIMIMLILHALEDFIIIILGLTNVYYYNYNPYYWGNSIYMGYTWWGPSYTNVIWFNNWYRPYNYYWGGWYVNNWNWYNRPYYNNWYVNNYWNGWNQGYSAGYSNYYNSFDNNTNYYGLRRSPSTTGQNRTTNSTSNSNFVERPSTYTKTDFKPSVNYERPVYNSPTQPKVDRPQYTKPVENNTWSSPKPQYDSKPVQNFDKPVDSRPSQNYSRPQPVQNYSRPENKPVQSYTRPQQSYSKPVQSYTRPQQNFNRPTERNFRQNGVRK
jgi:hypothetical protein